ncbi:hypothetical protein [Ruegeria arenilitoris]|uniref:hypothetical protein n=1 Tax=Ruegeria arenilitoris TaxID=1173585 RepID=UPI00148185CF|nr:hypothetical protein [Ruegeria arenilitoris]
MSGKVKGERLSELVIYKSRESEVSQCFIDILKISHGAGAVQKAFQHFSEEWATKISVDMFSFCPHKEQEVNKAVIAAR